MDACSSNDGGDHDDQMSCSKDEVGVEDRFSAEIRLSSSVISREAASIVNTSANMERKISSSPEDSGTEDAATSNSNGACIDKDIDVVKPGNTTLKEMSIEELKEEERWLEKAIIARIRYLKKDDENW